MWRYFILYENTSSEYHGQALKSMDQKGAKSSNKHNYSTYTFVGGVPLIEKQSR